ncbi:hypothetical protein C8F01DRAFT_1248264 [Mycena amicta]|nr:hypothetical protein C8F01DRAFT_1248264 [Mycena amicta]
MVDGGPFPPTDGEAAHQAIISQSTISGTTSDDLVDTSVDADGVHESGCHTEATADLESSHAERGTQLKYDSSRVAGPVLTQPSSTAPASDQTIPNDAPRGRVSRSAAHFFGESVNRKREGPKLALVVLWSRSSHILTQVRPTVHRRRSHEGADYIDLVTTVLTPSQLSTRLLAVDGSPVRRRALEADATLTYIDRIVSRGGFGPARLWVPQRISAIAECHPQADFPCITFAVDGISLHDLSAVAILSGCDHLLSNPPAQESRQRCSLVKELENCLAGRQVDKHGGGGGG